MSKPHLVSFDLCPFVQRSLAAMEEKGVEYEITYIDLANKPDWFLDISPLGKVPVVRVGDTSLFESAVIAEYLEEVYTPSLHPADPLEKGLHRSWMSYAAGLAGPGYLLMTVSDEAAAQKAADNANALLARLEEQVVGPFFAGETYHMIDAATASFLQRLVWADARAPQLGLFKDAPKCRAWADAVMARPSVKRSLKDDIDDRFQAYLTKNDAWIATSRA